MSILHDLVAARGYLLADGATGTELFRRGLSSGEPPEAWNVDHPDRIVDAYRAYVSAGSDLFLTNSFGGTHFRLALHKLDDRVHELNAAAARLARQVADEAMAAEPGRTVVVAGSMGPSGELLEPMGSMTPETCRRAFAAQAAGLADGGADVAWIETMSSIEEATYAVAGVRETTDLPICVTMSFDTAGRTMMGVDGERAADMALELGIDALGANCGNNLADTEAAIAEMAQRVETHGADSNLLLISKGNAGIPQWQGTDLHYDGTPEVMAAYAHRARSVGASIIGACCGSAAEHISMMRQVLDGEIPVPEVEEVTATTKLVAKKRTSRRRRR